MRSGRRGAVLDVVRGVLAGAACTLAGMLALGLLAGYTGITDSTIQILNQCLKLISVLVGAVIAVRPGGDRGLVKGALTGALYMLLGLCAVTSLIDAQADWSVVLGELAVSAAVGAAAGVLMANLQKPRRRAAK
jgi:putative membrane protein (TIGR04086 family)